VPHGVIGEVVGSLMSQLDLWLPERQPARESSSVFEAFQRYQYDKRCEDQKNGYQHFAPPLFKESSVQWLDTLFIFDHLRPCIMQYLYQAEFLYV
jgi:hypothetical protein